MLFTSGSLQIRMQPVSMTFFRPQSSVLRLSLPSLAPRGRAPANLFSWAMYTSG